MTLKRLTLSVQVENWQSFQNCKLGKIEWQTALQYSFPMNGQTLGPVHKIKKLENFVSHKVSLCFYSVDLLYVKTIIPLDVVLLLDILK